MFWTILKKLFTLLLGHIQFADGKNVLTSGQALGAVLGGAGLAAIAGALLLNPDVMATIAPELGKKGAETLFLGAAGLIAGGVRWLIGQRAMQAKQLMEIQGK
jgi:hypothetical protein